MSKKRFWVKRRGNPQQPGMLCGQFCFFSKLRVLHFPASAAFAAQRLIGCTRPVLCFFFFLLLASPAFSQFYLLEQPIEEAILNGDFKVFKEICTEKVSVNLESPFRLKGYFYRERLSEMFTREFAQFQTQKIEWISLQVEENFAIQSLNVILRNKRSGKETYYKFIFFLTKDKEWKLYNLRGLWIE